MIFPWCTKLFFQSSAASQITSFINDHTDGIIFKSEQVISQTNCHPNRLNESDKDQMITAVSEELSKIHLSIYPKPIFYSYSNFSSDLLRLFKYGELEEKLETNPQFGWGGLTRITKGHSFFAVENQALRQFESNGHSSLKLVLPSARGSDEVAAAKKDILTKKLSANEIYLEVDSPENLFAADNYSKLVNNFIIDIDSLLAAFYKVDLNNAALVKNINFDTDLVSDITKEFIDIIGDSKTILIRLGKLIPPEELIKKAVTWGVAGLITAENDVQGIKKQISEAEFHHLTRK